MWQWGLPTPRMWQWGLPTPRMWQWGLPTPTMWQWGLPTPRMWQWGLLHLKCEWGLPIPRMCQWGLPTPRMWQWGLPARRMWQWGLPTPRMWQWGLPTHRMWQEDWIRMKLYDKRDYFNFPIVNFPLIFNKILATSAYEIYIFQLTRYSRVCGYYHDLLNSGMLLTMRLLNQWLLVVKLKSSLFDDRRMTWLTVMEYMCHKWPRICSVFRNHKPILSSSMTYHIVWNKSNTKDPTSGSGPPCYYGAPKITPGY
jgi:hypothetical protein